MINLCLGLYPVLSVSTVAFIASAVAVLWLRRTWRPAVDDRSARLLVFMLIVALINIGAFLFYAFVHRTGC